MRDSIEDALISAAMVCWFAFVALLCSCERMHRVPTRDDLPKARAADAALRARVHAFFGGAR